MCRLSVSIYFLSGKAELAGRTGRGEDLCGFIPYVFLSRLFSILLERMATKSRI